MKKTILRKYNSDSETKGAARGANVYQRMNNNPQFANEQLLVNLLGDKKEAYDVAKGAASSRDSIKIGIKNDCYRAYILQLDLVADAVEAKADGRVKIAEDAGFETISTTKHSIDFLGMPTGLKAEDVKGRKGFMKVGWDKDPDASMTFVEYLVLDVEGAVWQNGTHSSGSSVLVPGLPSGKYVSVRIYNIGRKGLKSDTTTDLITVLVS